MNCNYIYILLFTCIVISYLANSTKNKEQFSELNLPSFNKFVKYTRGYSCQNDLDSMPNWATEKYQYKSFCKRYPSSIDLDALSTTILEGPVLVNKTGLKVLKSSDLNVRHVMTDKVVKVKNGTRMKTAPIVENKNLMKTESITLLTKEPKYQYIAVGKNTKIGETIFYAGDINKIRGNETKDKNYDLFEKVSSVEYSFSTWLKIDDVSSSWRNIIHHGNSNHIRAPGIWIYPNETKLGIAILTDRNRNAWGEWMSFGGIRDIPLRKWCHITVTVSKNQVMCYSNGKLIGERRMGGNAIWLNNQKVHVVDPWHGAGNFHLSKMKWHPFNLTKEFVENMVFSTVPTKNFKSDHLLSVSQKPLINIMGRWKVLKWNNYSPLEIRQKNGMVFLDGMIYCSSSDINQPCFMIDNKFVPDRLVKVLVHGTGLSHIKEGGSKTTQQQGGLYLATIKPNGEVTLSAEGKHNYVKGIAINLSNIRYSINKGEPLKTTTGIQVSNESTQPGVSKIGSLLLLSGHAKNVRKVANISNMPSTKRPAENVLLMGSSSSGRLTRVDIYTSGVIRAIGPGHNDVYLDGITASMLKGDKIPLYSGFRNYHPWWGQSRVINDNGIVKLSGLIKAPDYGVRGWSIKNKGCFRDRSKRSLPRYHGNNHDKNSCAKKALYEGHNLFGLQWHGQCFTGNSYGQHGKAKNCNTKCRINKKDNCGGSWALNVHHIGDQWIHISTLPKKYAPTFHMKFLCYASWGFVSVTITTAGHIYINQKSYRGGNNTYISLDSITYLKD